MRLLHRPVGRHPDVELREMVRAAACACAGREARQARDIPWRRRGSARAARRAIRGPSAGRARWLDALHAPHNSHSAISSPNTASAPVSPAYWSSTERHDHRAVEQQVGRIMQPVGADRERPGAADDVALVADQRHGEHAWRRPTRRSRAPPRPSARRSAAAATARKPMKIAEMVIRITWTSEASASALPCPKRWS